MKDLCKSHYESERLEYRPLKPGDYEDVYEYGKDAETCKFLRWGPYKGIEEAEEFVRNKIAESDLQWAIVEKEAKKVIGTIRIYDDDNVERGIAISYILNRKFSGYGYATESLKSLIKIAQEIMKTKADILYIYYDIENVKSQNLIIRAGLIRDEVYETQMMIKGQWRTLRRYYICLKE